ncbi:unnamed protein product [Rotaria sp. Silwood1]|nr:unnamed protein product [Rotaria sp. Silwood1]
MGTEKKHWAKEVVRRTKQRDDIANSRFIQKKINRLVANIAKANATIADFQLQLIDYWSYANPDALAQRVVGLIAEKERTNQSTGQILSSAPLTTTITAVNATTTTSAYKDPVRETVDRIEHQILDYIYKNTSHVKKMFQGRVQLAKAEMEEFKALEDFEQVTTPSQWTIHLMLKSKVKVYSTKNKNYRIATKRVEYDLLPKFIDKIDFSFKIDESVVGKDEAQAMYDQMRKTTKDFRTQAMKLYVQSLAREHELLSNEIKRTIESFPKDNDEGFDAEASYASFKHYHELREKRLNLELEQSLHFLEVERVEGDINNQQEEIVAPTPLRVLGPEFSLQQ